MDTATTANGIPERLAGTAEEWNLACVQPQIAVCRRLFEQSGTIDVAVLRRFKAGKSSFLNPLVGRTVLPGGAVPRTAVVTRLRAGPVDRARVHFLDDTTHDIPLAEISSDVDDLENPGN